MEDKYQEALNRIKLTQVNFTDFGSFDLLQDFLPSEWIDTLQELIDNYSKLEAERNYMVMNNASLIDKNNQLEKALDIACGELRHSDYCDAMWECENNDISLKYESCEECIKDHFLKEVQDER